MEEGHSL
jgi:hypothetical protein